LETALNVGPCADETVPRGVRKKISRAMRLLEKASAAPPPRAGRLERRASKVLRRAGRAAEKAVSARKPKLSPECSAALQEATASVRADVTPDT
jgi:hypothetical protein